MEPCRLPRGLLLVEAQAVDLDHARVGLERLHVHRRVGDRREQPARHRGPDDDARVGPPGAEHADQLDVPGGVPEAVAGTYRTMSIAD